MSWKKCLYLEQKYPINYIEIQYMQDKKSVRDTHEDINRAILRISIVTACFCLFRVMMDEEGNRVSTRSWFSFISTFIEAFLENEGSMGMNLKPSFLFLMFAYLLSPLIRALTLEVCSDTVYTYFILTQFFFVVDSVSASIYNSGAPAEIKDAMVPLQLEESINIPKRMFSNQILGLTSYFLGSILLSSRLASPSSVFNFLCLTFVGYTSSFQNTLKSFTSTRDSTQ